MESCLLNSTQLSLVQNIRTKPTSPSHQPLPFWCHPLAPAPYHFPHVQVPRSVMILSLSWHSGSKCFAAAPGPLPCELLWWGCARGCTQRRSGRLRCGQPQYCFPTNIRLNIWMAAVAKVTAEGLYRASLALLLETSALFLTWTDSQEFYTHLFLSKSFPIP